MKLKTTLIVALLIYVNICSAAPEKKLWSFWAKHNSMSKIKIDHSKWQLILSKGIVKSENKLNLVNYPLLKEKYHSLIKEYIKYLSSIKILEYNKNEQLAYWANLYNAITIDLVLEHLPIDSIRDIKVSGFFSFGPWNHEIFTLYGHKLSLNDIEHRIIRPIWNDPRIHYILNCASIGCPNISKQAYNGLNINKLLDKTAREYINSPRGVSIVSDEIVLSKIYDWYRDDFGANDLSVLKHIKKYADPKLKKAINKLQHISDYIYDWELNCFKCDYKR